MAVIASLKLGDRVQLDWIEVKMLDGKVVSKCQSVRRVSAVQEQALVQPPRKSQRDPIDREYLRNAFLDRRGFRKTLSNYLPKPNAR